MTFRLNNRSYSWNFPSNNHGQIFGISDSGVETFNGTPIKSLAREICQNSIDANLQNGKPTHIQFKTFKIESSDIPQVDALRDAFTRAKEFWPKQDGPKANSFFMNALNLLKQKKIVCLRISDYNTTGLLGADKEYNSPWCNLTKSQGASAKSGSNGGSFGIGKFAPYACSAFRTVFYSTLDCEGIEAYQGVSRLTSFKNEDGEITQGTGFYGEEKNAPVKAQYSLAPEYERSYGNSGTDVFIIGFSEDENWQQKMVASILDGFLYAINAGDLTVEVEDLVINKDTLSELVISHKVFLEENADEYFKALTADEHMSPTYGKEFESLGKVTLRLMIQPEFHRRVAMVRKTGMKITDKGNIHGLIPFAGVLYIEGDGLNEYLRNLENPQHTKWEIDRAENKSKARKLISDLTKFIKSCLNELKNDDSEEALDPSVGEYLAAEAEEEKMPEDKAENINDEIKDFTIKTVTRSVKPENVGKQGKQTAEVDDEDGNIMDEDVPGKGGRSGDKTGGQGDGSGGHGSGDAKGDNPSEHKKGLMTVASGRTRVMCTNKANGEYTITFVPSASASDAYLDLFLSAESGIYPAALTDASCQTKSNIEVYGNRIKNLIFEESIPIKFRVKIDYYDYCSMEVKAYGNKM